VKTFPRVGLATWFVCQFSAEKVRVGVRVAQCSGRLRIVSQADGRIICRHWAGQHVFLVLFLSQHPRLNFIDERTKSAMFGVVEIVDAWASAEHAGPG